MVAVRGRSILLLASAFLVTVQAVQKDLLDDEFLKTIMDEMNLDEEDQARNLIDIEADGSLGSKCSVFKKCNAGFECFHTRCIPNRNCLKERLEEFDASFDSDGYKQAMFQKTGVTEEDVIKAYRTSGGDELAFANSNTIQSLVIYMKENTEPFEPVSEIVNSCAGLVSGRRLKVEKTTVRTGDKIVDNNVDVVHEMKKQRRRRLQTTPSPSAAPSLSAAPSISAAPSTSPSLSIAPTIAPSASPTIAPESQTFIGIHLEGGLIFELSLTISWLNGDASENQFVRGCFGAGIQGGIEFSFYIAYTFDGVRDGWACASVLFDTDAGLVLNLGMGFGICFAGSQSVYLEFTIGAGIGAGIGFNTCYTITRENPNSILSPTDSDIDDQRRIPLPLEAP